LRVRSDLGGLATSDSVGWISAIEYLPQGQQAVVISPDGKVHPNPGYTANSIDRDLAWSPHGNFLYFVSDRVDHNFNLFRWSPGSEKAAEQRTSGTRSRGDLKFSAQPTDEPDNAAKGLITTGGLVQEFDPGNQSTEQILPPTSKEITQTQGAEVNGTEGEFEGAYGSLGSSFRVAQWGGGKKYIAAIMRREAGEVLIVQDMEQVDGKLPPPRPIVAGERVDFAINPKDGNLVYCVQGFQWPAGPPPLGPKGEKPKKPFVNAVGVFEDAGKGFVIAANGGDIVFGSPAIGPDGTALVVVLGTYSEGEVNPLGIATLPIGKIPNFKPIQLKGDIHEPSWSPDGLHILAAVRRDGKRRTIYEIPLDGGKPRNVTGDVADFGFPQYSPQQKGG